MNLFWPQEGGGGTQKAFVHRHDCKIQAADPGVEIPWNEVRAGY